jgi:hypothetical protein
MDDERSFDSYLRVASADLRTLGSLSEMAAAIIGKALAGSHAPIPNLLSKLVNSSRLPCRVFATFDFIPCSIRSWKTRLNAYTFGNV